jgi:hypothetical protein
MIVNGARDAPMDCLVVLIRRRPAKAETALLIRLASRATMTIAVEVPAGTREATPLWPRDATLRWRGQKNDLDDVAGDLMSLFRPSGLVFSSLPALLPVDDGVLPGASVVDSRQALVEQLNGPIRPRVIPLARALWMDLLAPHKAISRTDYDLKRLAGWTAHERNRAFVNLRLTRPEDLSLSGPLARGARPAARAVDPVLAARVFRATRGGADDPVADRIVNDLRAQLDTTFVPGLRAGVLAALGELGWSLPTAGTSGRGATMPVQLGRRGDAGQADVSTNSEARTIDLRRSGSPGSRSPTPSTPPSSRPAPMRTRASGRPRAGNGGRRTATSNVSSPTGGGVRSGSSSTIRPRRSGCCAPAWPPPPEPPPWCASPGCPNRRSSTTPGRCARSR